MKKVLRINFLLLLMAFFIFSCTKRKKFDTAQLIVGLEGSPSSFDPRSAADAYSARINSLIYNGLVRIDEHGRIQPDLAEKWVRKGKRIIFYLRKGVRFQDGKELTSTDVKYTISSIFKMASPYQNSLKVIDSIDTPDKYTVVLNLKKIFAPLLTALNVGIVPKGDSSNRFKPIGTGPFKLSEFKRGDRVILSRFENYFGGRPFLKKIIFRVIPDDTTRVMELLKGSVQLLQNSIPPDSLDEIKKDKKVMVRIETGVNVSYLGFNLRDRYLKDIRVRRAIAMAINREEIIHYLLKGLAVKASSIIAPSNWAYAEVTLPTYDPDAANRILDKAGYRKDKNGIRFTLEYKTSVNRLRRRIAEAIASDLKRIGINVVVRSYEFGTFFSDIRKGVFQLYSLTWVGITDPDILYYAFDSKSLPPEGANRNFFIDPQFDTLVGQARYTLNEDLRKKLYAKAQKIIAAKLPVLPLWYHYNIMAYTKGLEGIKIFPGGEYVFLKDVKWNLKKSSGEKVP